MLSPRHSPRSFSMNLTPHVIGYVILTNISTFRLRGECDWRNGIHMGRDQFAFAFVPSGEQLGRRSCTDETWVRDSGESDARNVTRGGINTCKKKRSS